MDLTEAMWLFVGIVAAGTILIIIRGIIVTIRDRD